MNWWPQRSDTDGYTCDVLWNDNWTAEGTRDEVGAELDHLASLGVEVLRLMFWPPKSGWNIDIGSQTVSVDSTQFVDANLPELLNMIDARGMKVILALGNFYTNWICSDGSPCYQPGPCGKVGGTGGTCNTFWSYGYGTNFGTCGSSGFLGGAVTWANRILSAAANHPAVLYVDLHNEVDSDNVNIQSYATCALGSFAAPTSKVGFSVMGGWGTDTTKLRANASVVKTAADTTNKMLRFADFHVYPFDSGANWPVVDAAKAALLQTLQGRLAGPVINGEFGCMSSTSPGCSEAAQLSKVQAIASALVSASIPFGLNWTFTDFLYSSPEQRFGLAQSNDEPKHVLGWWASNLGMLPNADMESGSGTGACGDYIASWGVGGSGIPSVCEARWGGEADSASGSYYGRVWQNSATSGAMWLTSSWITVPPGATVYANAYVRGAGVSGIKLFVHEYSASGAPVQSTATPGFTPLDWTFYNLRYNVRGSIFNPPSYGFNVTLSPSTTQILVSVYADVRASPAYLDVDAVSLSYH